MGSLKDRLSKLEVLDLLPPADRADDTEVFRAIEENRWFSRGIGFVDAQLLASAMATPQTRLWTADNRLSALADEHDVRFAR